MIKIELFMIENCKMVKDLKFMELKYVSLLICFDFIKNAEKIRKEVEGINKDIVKNRKSRYNSNVIVDKCKICDNAAEETHHIYRKS